MKKTLYVALLCIFSCAITSCSSDNDGLGNDSSLDSNAPKFTEVKEKIIQVLSTPNSEEDVRNNLAEIFAVDIFGSGDFSSEATAVIQKIGDAQSMIFDNNKILVDHLYSILESSALDKTSNEYKRIEAAIYYQDFLLNDEAVINNTTRGVYYPKIKNGKICVPIVIKWKVAYEMCIPSLHGIIHKV